MILLVIVFSIALFVTIFVVAFLPNMEPKALYEQGFNYEMQHDYQNALKTYQTLLNNFPNNDYSIQVEGRMSECYAKWASTLESEDKYGEAIEKYQTALTYPESDHTQYSYSYSYIEGQIDDCYESWGLSLEDEQKYSEAIEKYQLSGSASYQISNCYKSWGLALEDEQKYSEAIEKYQLSGLASYQISNCYYEWGLLLQNQEKYDEAISKYQLSDLDAAEEALPYCYYEKVSQLVSKTEYDNAVATYFELLTIYPDSTWSSFENSIVLGRLPDDVLFNLGVKYQKQNSDDIAILLYENLLQNYPESEYVSQTIDNEVAIISEGSSGILPPLPAPSPQQLQGKVELVLINDTPYTLTIMLSGQSSHLITINASPESYEYFVGPFSGSAPESAKRQTMTLEPGVFQIVAKVNDVRINWYHGEITLDGDNLYTEWFYITSHF